MPKKNKKANANLPADDESAGQKPEVTESASAEGEAVISTDTDQDEIDEAAMPEASVDSAEDISVDDLLDDVRRSLIEDEAEGDEKKPAWWNKRGKGKTKDQNVAAVTPVEEAAPSEGGGEYLDEIDELIDLLEPEAEAPKVEETETVIMPAVEPEAPVDVDELKKRVFTPSEPKEEQEDSEVRAIALEGGEEVFVEVESKKADPFDERMKALENSFKPYQRYIYLVAAFFGILVAVFASVLMYRFYLRSLPPEPVKAVSNLPYPIAMSLPGGLNFNLGKGAIKDGQWNPRGPEWLEGTEICRWVAIPWSTQLEAVVRTLTPQDTIELRMSNQDKLTYTVHSRDQLTLAEMQKLDSNSPCLLLVLAKQDSDKRWVVTALP